MSNTLKDQLFAAFEERQIVRFQRALKDLGNAQAIEATELLKRICHAPDSVQFLKAYLDAGCNPGKEYDGKYSIHSVAECLDVENLKILLESDPTLANRTDSRALTPLHVVIAATKTDNLVAPFEMIKLLIQQNADINLATPTSQADTPFNLLVEKLKSVSDKKKRHEILEFVYQNVPFININTPKREGIQQLLKVYHEKLWERLAFSCYDGKSTQQVLGTLLDHLNNDEKKMIQDLYTLQQDPKLKNVVQEVFDDGKLLEESIKNGLVLSVKMLIRAGADPFRKPDTRDPAIQVACSYGNPAIVQVILDSSAKFVCSEPLLHHTIKNFKRKGFYEPDTDHEKVFDMLLDNANIDVNELDQKQHSVLFYAICNNDKVSIRKLLQKHAFIGSMCNMISTMPIDSIDPELLEQYFDTCIQPKDTNSNPGDNGYELIFNYTCFKPPTGAARTVNDLTTINYIASKKKFQHLMTHPLITSFLFLKWYPLSPFFYANLLLYTLICLMLVAYIVFQQEPKVSRSDFWWVPFIFAMSIMLRELGQFAFSPKRYVTSISNYVELILVTLVWLMVFDNVSLLDPGMRRAVGAVVILLAMMEMIILIGALPIFSISTYMIMLKKITVTFLKIFCLYSLILGAFACSFYKLFSVGSDSRFSDLPSAFLKTLVMFTGEYEAGDIDFSTSPWMSYTMFVAFIFFISIVMMNLLSGLAVSDTQVIRAQAALIDWIERAKLLSRFERSIMYLTLVCPLIPEVLKANEVSIQINHYANGNVIIPMIVREAGAGGADKLQAWWRRWFNWFLNKALIFDYEIVKQAIGVMDMCACREEEQNFKKREVDRMDGIEQTLNEVLRLMKVEKTQGQGAPK